MMNVDRLLSRKATVNAQTYWKPKNTPYLSRSIWFVEKLGNVAVQNTASIS